MVNQRRLIPHSPQPAARRTSLPTTVTAPPVEEAPKTAAPKRLKIVKPGAVNRDSMCIYGYPDSGKTTLFGTMKGRLLLVEAVTIETGTKPLASQRDRIDVLEIETWDDVMEAIDYCVEQQSSYDAIGFDTVTAFMELAKRKVKGDSWLHTVRQKNLSINPLTNDYDVTLQDWGMIGELVGRFIYGSKAIKRPKVILARARRSEDRKGDMPTIEGPDLTPAAMATLMPSMALVGRLYNHPVRPGLWERRLQVRKDNNHLAKFTVEAERYNLVPATIRNPHLGDIWSFIEGDGDPPEGVDEMAERRSSGALQIISD